MQPHFRQDGRLYTGQHVSRPLHVPHLDYLAHSLGGVAGRAGSDLVPCLDDARGCRSGVVGLSDLLQFG